MIVRAFSIYIAFAALLLALALYVQDLPLEANDPLWALFFALPLGICALRGECGRERFEYPGAPFIVVGTWIATMAPSFIVDHPASHLMYIYTDEAIQIGRLLFFVWCLAFVLLAGPANRQRSSLEPRALDVISVGLPIGLAVSYQLAHGMFSNYYARSSGESIVLSGGGLMSVSTAVGQTALVALPCFFQVILVRAQSRGLRWAAGGAFALTWVLLFLSGSRGPLAYAVALCFFAARVLGVRFRTGFNAVILIALPLAFFLVYNYRSALRDSEDELSTVSGFTSVAVDSTHVIMSERGARQDALLSFSDNIKLRMWYGPQFFAVVDEWLAHGASLRGTFLDGAIRSLPSWASENKNQIADDYKLEDALVRTGRFPDIDLGPMPWLQWLYELGGFGLFLGSLLYARLVRLIDRRVSATRSPYELLFWAALLSQVCSPEHVTDTLIVSARNIGAIILIALAVRFALQRVLLPALKTRRRPAGLDQPA